MIVILLPAYDEAESLPKLLPKIHQAMINRNVEYRIIACNDGSQDQTGELLEAACREYPLEIIHHKINRGLGETIRDLFERAAEITQSDDVVVRMDCDDTHDPETIFKMISKLDEGFDVVIASRFQEGGGQKGVDRYRAFISYCAQVFMRIFFHVEGVKEYSSGFRTYRAAIIKNAIDFYGNNFIQLKGLGFTCTLEKIIKLHILGAKFTEVGSMLRYDQKASTSKMVTSITTLGYLVMTLMYHWPWGGWRRGYRTRVAEWERKY